MLSQGVAVEKSKGKVKSRQDWAWEFLRRNPKFREAWPAISKSFELHRIAGTHVTEVAFNERDSTFEPWGCLFCDAPTQPPTLGPLWNPRKSGEVLHLTARHRRANDHTDVFDLAGLHCQVTMFIDRNGTQHLLFRENVETLQVCITGASMREPVVLLADASAPKRVVKARLRALACIMELQNSGHLLAGSCSPQPRTERLDKILVALDAWLKGANYREIGVSLYGRRRVEEDWADPGRHMLDHVRRAVRRGRSLIEGGYLEFLC